LGSLRAREFSLFRPKGSNKVAYDRKLVAFLSKTLITSIIEFQANHGWVKPNET